MMLETITFRSRRLLASAAVAALVLAGVPAFADTPADTLVQAWAIDDIITLDPGEAFEISTGEITGNTYDMLVRLDINDTTKVVGGIAESWTVSDDGLTYTFKLKPGLKFASGNPITAEDVAWSFERAVKLNKSPAFILQQFGLNGDNVAEKAKATDASTFVFTVDKSYAPSFVLNCLTATVASVVDSKLVKEHVAAVTPSDDYKFDNDFGNGWLKTNYAGSGPYKMREWRANEVVVMERNDNYYGTKADACARHLPAREGKRDPAPVAREGRHRRRPQPRAGRLRGGGRTTPTSPRPPRRRARSTTSASTRRTRTWPSRKCARRSSISSTMTRSVDTCIKGIGEIHQNFLPKGVLGALTTTPTSSTSPRPRNSWPRPASRTAFPSPWTCATRSR